MTTEVQKRQWTGEQLAAIQARQGNLLVAAAAGAGKTAVLVERIIQRLTDPDEPLSLENMVVVTFTEAAAAEMRQRIGAALEDAVVREPENQNIRRQLMLLNRSHISTIHSFCLWVLRTYFYRLDLDPAFRVMDPVEADLLKLEVMDQVLEDCFAAEPEGGAITDLADSLGGRSDASLADLVLKVWEFSRSLPWPEDWLEKAAATYQVQPDTCLESLPWYPELEEAIALQLQEAVFYLRLARELAISPGGPAVYLDNLANEIIQAESILADLGNLGWEELNRKLAAFSFNRLKPVRRDNVDSDLKEKTTELRDKAKKILKRLQEEFCREEKILMVELTRAGKSVAALVELVCRFGAAFQNEKRRRSLVDFGDLEHFCLQVLLDAEAMSGQLRPSVVAQELRRRFAEILVDEYQDINSIQDAILSLIARQENPNLFMVGDVKQSIYRFRMANPGLFLEKYRCYSEDAKAKYRRILLTTNFRSRRSIIDGVNFIFRQVFSSLVGELDYDDAAALVAQANYPEHPAAVTTVVELYLLEKQIGSDAEVISPEEEPAEIGEAVNDQPGTASLENMLEELTVLEREALLVARKIRELVEGTAEKPGPQCQVWDPANNWYRDITYRDIVILLRATSNRAPVFLEALRQHNIPAYAELSSGYFSAIEVETILSLLQVIDNPRQDIPLVAVLRSPLVGLTAEELTCIRLVAPREDFFKAVRKAAGLTDGGQADVKVSKDLAAKLQVFLTRLEGWRTIARRNPLGDVIWQLYRDTGYLEFVGGLPGGVQRQANLRALLDRARQFESFTRHGLFRFLRFIDRLREQEGDLGTARALGENENVVRIMSIHKAKGLEFPVVIVADLGKMFNLQDLSGDILLHSRLGLAPLCMEPEAGIKYPTLPYLAISNRLRLEALSEEVRILYVAMTRAREKLILVGSAADLPRQAERWCAGIHLNGQQLPPVLMAGARTPLDWVCPALARHPQGAALPELAGTGAGYWQDDFSCWQVWVLREPSLISVQVSEAEEEEGSPKSMPELLKAADVTLEKIGAHIAVTGASEEDFMASMPQGENFWRQEVARCLSWVYPQEQLTSLPVKLTVTDLKRRFDVFSENNTPMRPGYYGFSRRPALLQEQLGPTAAERGTATHLFLQHINLKQMCSRENLNNLLQAMIEREILTAEQAKVVDMEAVAAFFGSPLGRRLLARPEKVRRELPFSLAVPVRELYPQLSEEIAAGEQTLVQGIIDCLLEEEDGFLVLDFKTGKVPADPLAAYREQIQFYCRAVTTIFKRPVREAYLYFLDSREDFRVL